MVGVTFFGTFDLASAAIWAFWIFFAGLIVYIQRENMREGYPLVDDDGHEQGNLANWPLPSDKTFLLPHGRSDVTVPSGQRRDRLDFPMARTSMSGGSPYIPTGNPMVDGIGPAAWADRRDLPELDGHGHPKIRPLSSLPEFRVSAGRDPRGLPVVSGDGEVVGRVTDIWIDVPEQNVRYFGIDLNPEGTGKTRLIPYSMAKIGADRLTVTSLTAALFEGIPTTRAGDAVTLLEEEKISAWVAAGPMYGKGRA